MNTAPKDGGWIVFAGLIAAAMAIGGAKIADRAIDTAAAQRASREIAVFKARYSGQRCTSDKRTNQNG